VPQAAAHRGRVSFCDRVRTCQRWDCIIVCQRERAKQARFASLHVPSHVPSHPQNAAKVQGFSRTASAFTAETDWLLEEGGFELVVPPRTERTWGAGTHQHYLARERTILGAPSPLQPRGAPPHWGGNSRRSQPSNRITAVSRIWSSVVRGVRAELQGPSRDLTFATLPLNRRRRRGSRTKEIGWPSAAAQLK
jgi:hypothetical protein